MAQKTAPILLCACGARVPIDGLRIGDTATCPSCRAPSVVLRSKVQGEVPPAAGAPGATSDRLPEIQDSLRRIRLRRAGHAARGVALYPVGAVLALGFFGFYLPAILTGQNLAALGFPERGRRVQVLGVGAYLLIGAAALAAYVRYAHLVPGTPAMQIGALLAVALVGGLAAALAGRGEIAASFEAGARPASVVVPALVGFLLVVAQFFAVKFIDIATAW